MGSCVSVHKDPESAMKLRLSIGSKNEKLVIPSPVKDKPDAVNVGNRTIADLALKSQWSPARFTAGSKDEAFFDSQPWLESDCEDDFFSVNGILPFSWKYSSPPQVLLGKPTKLFKESLRDDQYTEEETAARNKDEAPENVVPEATSIVQPPKSTNATPYLSGANSGNSSERTPNGVLKAEDKSVKSAQCCIPRLLSSRSFSERRKRTNPAPNVG
ncbi:hypothetical protein Sango_1759000 [Sesamum angolense]|uniref:Uncharacterized protein n=1 Tax=Sesamum angolense TaxID=2727404 RepID=A0AAE2BPE6_9LAMI|nr:hypothetical protein Sango_1759000 [Sesamum angolense]